MANMTFGVNLIPDSNNTRALGNSDKKWNAYLQNINGVDAGAFNLVNLIHYRTCSTSADTRLKKIEPIYGMNSPVNGISVRVKFENAQSYDGVPSLCLYESGSDVQVANKIYRNGSTPAGLNEWGAGDILDLVYDGTNWVIVNGGNLKIS